MGELSTKYNPAEVEERHYAAWEKAGYFRADPAHPGAPFTIVIPPPNVTGMLHIGHALNGTLQDILTRWRRMQGRNALWLPGTDHAGIATQHVVERKLRADKIDPRALGRDEFIKRVWEWKEQYGSTIIRQLKSIGSSCDWSRERFTMDPGLSRAVRVVFKRLYDEGLIYRGDYMVNWSPKLQTALSDDEVEHREIDGHLWHFRYPYADGSGHAIVAATRPETMLGDTAVAVNPDDGRYKNMIGRMVTLPLMNRPIPIIADSFVDKEFGTGMVKVTPAHDPNDYWIGQRHNANIGQRHVMPFINILDVSAHLNENVPAAYRGMEHLEARKAVV
ncbi:class I tRNA ligase family protein, partial [Candidatus Sumerlaeota bacterium]|nr:class I tRNA ligase family protein [Candidatus Sumerlaeota bacterium]